jgi:hypothetical protein
MEATKEAVYAASSGVEKGRMRDEPEAALTVQSGPTAKEMAAVEEINAVRNKARIEREQALAEGAAKEQPTLIEVAAQGMDALHAAIQARSQEVPPPYTPPPRTERQMSQLKEELEAGRKTQQRAEAQQASRPVEKADVGKEGFTTPVYRPDNMVPDPMLGLGAQGVGVHRPITEK